MEAIREIVKVKNRQVIINLPDDFNADEVEVIVLKTIDSDLSEEQKIILENRLNEPETEYITSQESLDLLKKKYGF
ncbi:hypothetical protein SAMN05421741_11522 [Paenimyroides ummariense]|uniref:Uncharacterized protein n=1 Tax=Paenimyroides ummariense TaxID=913024 RepID=A0A1I5DAH7_9FLAO|nr:hypothetical protein [Paenimyroides ummariense]SFN96268.1 hypothetical protein SAMN05421741_11522 [Paenimyroides ummariense]